MNWLKFLVPVLGLVLLGAAWQAYGWAGVAIAASGLVMWVLLHFNRMVHVMKKAANRPIGSVGSAVMLNAKLKPKAALLHVMALTGSMGERLSAEGEQPEIYRWTDAGDSRVTCEFVEGRLVRWTLERPPESEGLPPGAAP